MLHLSEYAERYQEPLENRRQVWKCHWKLLGNIATFQDVSVFSSSAWEKMQQIMISMGGIACFQKSKSDLFNFWRDPPKKPMLSPGKYIQKLQFRYEE